MVTSTSNTGTNSEFDSHRGFAAIDAFFKGSSSDVNPSLAKLDASTFTTKHHHRRGVGAQADAPSSTTASTNTLNQSKQEQRILQVGSQRRRKRPGYNDDDEDDQDVEPNNDNGDSGDEVDEEKGRTAMIHDINNKKIVYLKAMSTATTSAVSPQQMKKKQGKKERKLQQTDSVSGENVEKGKGNCDESATNNSKNAVRLELNEEDEVENTKQHEKPKRKRKKIRSKQKNIRKDHRDVKPSHLLQQGGRPLTAETRAKLNAPIIMKQPL
jgi:hypothetical protein